jgi:hypothetical protein
VARVLGKRAGQARPMDRPWDRAGVDPTGAALMGSITGADRPTGGQAGRTGRRAPDRTVRDQDRSHSVDMTTPRLRQLVPSHGRGWIRSYGLSAERQLGRQLRPKPGYATWTSSILMGE